MNWQDLLTNEAISNYIVFVLGLLVGLLVWAIKVWILPRPKSSVRVEKTKEASLIDVAPEIRNHVLVEYKGTPVDTFHQATFVISNRGTRIIDGIELDLHFEDNAEVLDQILEDPMGEDRRESQASMSQPDSTLHVSIPYLNPDRPYKDRLVLTVYSPKLLNVASLAGGGRGWSVEYADRVAYYNTLTEMLGETPTTNVELVVAASKVAVKQMVRAFRLAIPGF